MTFEVLIKSWYRTHLWAGLFCLEVECPSDFDEADAKLIDGAHMVICLGLMQESSHSVTMPIRIKVIPYIERQLANTNIVDVIWDRYLPDSLKATTRQRSGTGIDMIGIGHFRENWNSYLQNVSNKVELFHYHVSIHCFCEGKVVIWTLDENVLGSPMPDADDSEYPLRPRNHEEFGTRVMLYATDAVSYGYKRILIIATTLTSSY